MKDHQYRPARTCSATQRHRVRRVNRPLTASETHEWGPVELTDASLVTPQHIRDVKEVRSAGVIIRQFVNPAACAEVCQRTAKIGLQIYPGMTAAQALGALWPSHWVPKFSPSDSTWEQYFARAEEIEKQKEYVFAPIGDPREQVASMLMKQAGIKVEWLVWPGTQRVFHSMIVRAGAAELHFDNPRRHLPEPVAAMIQSQLAWNIYLSNPSGGELLIYRQVGIGPALTRGEADVCGSSVVGNYAIPMTQLLEPR